MPYNVSMKFIQQWLSRGSFLGLLFLAMLVGVGGAIGAAIFHSLIAFTLQLFYGDVSTGFVGVVEGLPAWQRILIPTVGGLLVGLLFWLTRVTEAEGEGVPEVIEALTLKQGNIRPVVAPVKIVAAALTLGSGGSAGREGPVIQIGSAIGSAVGQFFKVDEKERSLLLAAGAAAAIGGTFGAPIGGVVFTMEILKHRTTIWRSLIIIIAALVGTIGARILIPGHQGLRLTLETLSLSSEWLPVFIAALIIGVLAALTALLFGSVIRRIRRMFDSIKISHYLKPALGGCMVGVVGLFLPYIHEPAAYPLMVNLIAISSLPVSFLLCVFVIKIFATGLTLGSGGVGGIFAPSLLLGMLLGSVVAVVLVAYGLMAPALIPLVVVLGMAAVFAGAAHAPVTAALIAMEITDATELLLPLLLACTIAVLIAKTIRKDSLYHHQALSS